MVELLIAVTITALAMSAVYTSFIVQQRSFVAQDQVAETQISSKIAFDLITSDIRTAGFGYPDDETPDINGISGAININNASGANNSDTINLIAGFKQIATLQSYSGNTITISYTGSNKFNKTNRKNISLNGIMFAAVNNCTVVDGDCSSSAAITLDRYIVDPIPTNSPVYLVEDVTYQIVSNDLQRVRAGGGTENVNTIANNIDDFQIVHIDANGDSEINLGDRLRINILAKTRGQDQNLSPDTKPYYPNLTLEDHSTSVNDKYRRRIWSKEVALRN